MFCQGNENLWIFRVSLQTPKINRFDASTKGYNNTDEVNDDFISERRNGTAGDERDRDGDDDAKEYAAQADDTSPRTC